MLEWNDIRVYNTVEFGALEVGVAFEYGEVLGIKVSGSQAFDVINLRLIQFANDAPVEERGAEIIFK